MCIINIKYIYNKLYDPGAAIFFLSLIFRHCPNNEAKKKLSNSVVKFLAISK